jgi:glutathione S-transferase
VKLYHDKRAPNPRRVRIFLAEKRAHHEIDLELAVVDIAAREHQTEAFLALNPLGLLPVLELDDGRLLRESVAICRYLEELYPEPCLLGAEPYQRAVIEQWNRHMELELLVPVSQTFRNTHAFWKDRIEQVPEWGELSRKRSLERLAWLDRELADRPFIAGDQLSIADITALCAIDFGRISGIRITEDQPNLTRWYQSITSRPSTKA